ncbi:MAG: hypothetical protein ACYC0H_06455 [Solirubrobacteraceae bacterium]
MCTVAGFGALSAGSAAAGTVSVVKPDPQTTNVPYLAWAGEQIRFETCLPFKAGVDTSTWGLDRAELLVEDWSGTPSQAPQIEDPTVKLFLGAGGLCAQGDAISLDPGMARIELDITDNAGILGLPITGGPAVPVFKHQFLGGWMTLNDPSLTELGATSFASSAQTNAAAYLGDPAGDGHFVAGNNPGILSVDVTGSMPMTGSWAALVGKSSVTLPNDWATLANALATDSNPSDANPAMRWDIHDDSTDFAGHTLTSGCPSPFTVTPIDAVDNCTGGGDTGPFSTVFGLSSKSTIGPFDPVRANDTLLSDGKLDAGDAPMPAARIDVSIASNSGGSTDISGAGYLAPANKDMTYSRDFTGAATPHNLYAPFYNTFLPATAAGPVSSGIDGPASGSNFPGFLNSSPEYHFWDIAYTLASNAGGPTGCLRFSQDPQTDNPASHPGDYYQMPSGPSSVVVYTDEHGQAQVQYVPGNGFYYDSLLNSGAAISNANGGCDLQNVGLLGTADISAVARYPYKPVDYPSMTSNVVHKDVRSLWSKTLAYFPKGTGAANANARIVVAHAQDIDGTPFTNEAVCFSSNAESMTWFNGTIQTANGPVDLSGTRPTRDPKAGLNRLCVKTDRYGNAAVEVFESQSIHVNVVGDFANEGILRSIDVDFTTPGSTQGTVPPTPSDGNQAPAVTPQSGPSGTTAPSTTVLQQVAPKLAQQGTPAVSKYSARIRMARLHRPVRGYDYVAVRVASTARIARIRLSETIRVRRHSRMVTRHRTITRTVHTNRLVKIGVGSAVTEVKVSLLK